MSVVHDLVLRVGVKWQITHYINARVHGSMTIIQFHLLPPVMGYRIGNAILICGYLMKVIKYESEEFHKIPRHVQPQTVCI